jgi:hypothetical protein
MVENKRPEELRARQGDLNRKAGQIGQEIPLSSRSPRSACFTSGSPRVTFGPAFRHPRMFTMKNLPLVAAATAALTLASAVLAADNAKPNRAFSKADTNGDGKISEAEYLAAVKDKTEEAKTAFARRDTNKDGALSADEFKVAGKKGAGEKPKEKKRKKDKE